MCPAKTARESQKPNSNDWNYIDGKKACYSCGLFGTRVDCPARKCAEYDYVTKELRVHHFGNHICELGVLKDTEDNEMKDFYEGYEDYGLKKMRNKNILKDINESNFKKVQASVKC